MPAERHVIGSHAVGHLHPLVVIVAVVAVAFTLVATNGGEVVITIVAKVAHSECDGDVLTVVAAVPVHAAVVEGIVLGKAFLAVSTAGERIITARIGFLAADGAHADVAVEGLPRELLDTMHGHFHLIAYSGAGAVYGHPPQRVSRVPPRCRVQENMTKRLWPGVPHCHHR